MAVLLPPLHLAYYVIFLFVSVAPVLRNPELYCAHQYRITAQNSLKCSSEILVVGSELEKSSEEGRGKHPTT